jgi:hypothetical protein
MSTDTSDDAVERLARILDASECCVSVGGAGSTPPRANCCGECPRVPAATLRALLAERARMRGALDKAAKQFTVYAESHAMKGTDDGAKKAQTNWDMARMCMDALSGTEGARDG